MGRVTFRSKVFGIPLVDVKSTKQIRLNLVLPILTGVLR